MSIQEEIKAFVDGELSPEMTDQVRQEVERDPQLAQQVAHYRLMGDALRAMAVEPKVAGAETALKKVQPRNWRQKLVLVAVPVSIALLSAIIFPVFAQAKFAAKRSADSGTVLAARQAMKEPMAEDTGRGLASSPATVSVPSLQTPVPSHDGGENSNTDLNLHGFKNGQVGSIQGYYGADQNGSAASGTVRLRAVPKAVGGAGEGTDLSGYSNSVTNKFATRTPSHTDHRISRAGSEAPAQVVAPAPQPVRMVVENGTIEVVVDDVSRAQSEAMNYAKSIGGFSSNSSLDKDADDGTATAELTLRVPVARFETAMDHLKHMAKSAKDISAVHVTGEDVTGQYVDTTARLKELRAEEDSYVGMLRNTHHMDDTLAVKDRISDVRQQIESLESQAATLKDTSALSTIEVTFHQRPKLAPKPKAQDPKGPGWADAAWSDAKTGMASTTQNLGVLGIYLFVYSPLWIPLAFLGWLGAKRLV